MSFIDIFFIYGTWIVCLKIGIKMNFFYCFLFFNLVNSVNAFSKPNGLVSSESFEFLHPERVKFLKDSKNFSSSKTLYESKKKHGKGKKLLLSLLKNPNHPDYEIAVNYAGDCLSKKLRKASKTALENIFDEPGGDRFLEKSYAYFKQNDSSFLHLEALENLVYLASNPRIFFDKRTKLQAFIAMKILQENGMLPEGSFGEFVLEMHQ
ncbi:MAG: hypothetical protein ACRCUQ_04350 [Alphaproteobacteria bacterium]